MVMSGASAFSEKRMHVSPYIHVLVKCGFCGLFERDQRYKPGRVFHRVYPSSSELRDVVEHRLMHSE